MSLAKNTDPLYLRFYEQRHRAKQRGIEWLLQYWEWLQIWQDSGHLHERGQRKGLWVMARNGDTGPYAADNVKIVRCETNLAMENAARRKPYGRFPARGRKRGSGHP